jgi:DNA (cytosine-5)-methyltransferase 1
MLKFCDLFAGVGGFHLGMIDYFECSFAVEWNKDARATYSKNFPDTLIFGDITKLDYGSLPDFDILCGGFPCQPFSLAGKQDGFDHETQGQLFFNILAMIDTKKPRVVFLENVKNLISHDKGDTFKIIKICLEKAGYTVKYKVLDSAKYGNVPQHRERIFILAFLNVEDANEFSFPDEVPLIATLKDVLEATPASKYYQTNLKSPSVKKMLTGVLKESTIYQYRRYYMREIMSGLCPTLTANMGSGGHNVPLLRDHQGVRKLTPRECFNLQAFPVSYQLIGADSSLYKQIGNAVTVSVIKAIAKQLNSPLEKSNAKNS